MLQPPGIVAAGFASTVSRSDHVHPAQTMVSGNAGSATKLTTARTILTNLASKFDKGEWAYSSGEVVKRLGDTALSSALTFGLTNIPGAVHNTYGQNRANQTAAQKRAQLAAEGEKRLLSGEMPTTAQLEALGMSEPEALGHLAVLQMESLGDAAEDNQTREILNQQFEGDSKIPAQYGDDFGKMGIYVENPNIKVDWMQYAEHGAERMQQREMTQEMINSIVEKGRVLSQNKGTKFAYITKEGVAIVSKEGKLITAWSSADFDSNMMKIIEQLYGK